MHIFILKLTAPKKKIISMFESQNKSTRISKTCVEKQRIKYVCYDLCYLESKEKNSNLLRMKIAGRDSSVGITTGYGLDGPGIESRWGRDFPHPYRPAQRPTQPPVQWVPGLSPGVKRPGRSADHLPPSKCRGQERVGLCLYSPSGPSWPVIGRT